MAIQFKHRGETYKADTPEEAVKLRELLLEQDAKVLRDRAWARSALAGNSGLGAAIEESVLERYGSPWTPQVFLQFIARLGKQQISALSYLVIKKKVTDDEMRTALRITKNQALAGVLSGISKQAAALDIPARDIFTIENFRSSEGRRSTYLVSDKFAEIAYKMTWPGD